MCRTCAVHAVGGMMHVHGCTLHTMLMFPLGSSRQPPLLFVTLMVYGLWSMVYAQCSMLNALALQLLAPVTTLVHHSIIECLNTQSLRFLLFATVSSCQKHVCTYSMDTELMEDTRAS